MMPLPVVIDCFAVILQCVSDLLHLCCNSALTVELSPFDFHQLLVLQDLAA